MLATTTEVVAAAWAAKASIMHARSPSPSATTNSVRVLTASNKGVVDGRVLAEHSWLDPPTAPQMCERRGGAAWYTHNARLCAGYLAGLR